MGNRRDCERSLSIDGEGSIQNFEGADLISCDCNSSPPANVQRPSPIPYSLFPIPSKIGVMGGTFDPIHYGHLILAEQAREKFGLGKVLFVTSADPPHKADRLVSDASARVEMTRRAIDSNPHFVLSNLEIERPGPSYMIDTLRQIREIYGPQIGVYLLIGADEARDFVHWRDPYGIMELAKVVVANRPGCAVEDAISSMPAEMAQKIEPLEMPGVDISSTDLRARVAAGRSIRYLVPEEVEKFVAVKGLYGGRQ